MWSVVISICQYNLSERIMLRPHLFWEPTSVTYCQWHHNEIIEENLALCDNFSFTIWMFYFLYRIFYSLDVVRLAQYYSCVIFFTIKFSLSWSLKMLAFSLLLYVCVYVCVCIEWSIPCICFTTFMFLYPSSWHNYIVMVTILQTNNFPHTHHPGYAAFCISK